MANILVTGHSLGGAIATLAALELRIIYGNSVHLINFGSPRVGNKSFANKVNELFNGDNSFRVTHDNDPVPSVPFKLFWDFGYHHISREVWYSGNEVNDYVICDSTGEDSDCHEGWNFVWDLFEQFFEDHLNYLGESVLCD